MHAQEYKLMAQYAAVHWWYVGKRALLKQLFQNFILPAKKQPLNLLDLGSGTGPNWPLLSSYGKVTGVEQSALAVKFCKALGWKTILQSTIQNFAFPKNTFDVVTILDVLYHKKITNDARVLGDIYTTLKPGGWLIITDSAGPEWYGPHDVSNEARERYTLPEIVAKTQSVGFAIKHQTYFYCSTFPLFMASRILEKLGWLSVEKTETPPTPFINKLLILIMSFEAQLAAKLKLPFGSSVVVLAQKPRK